MQRLRGVKQNWRQAESWKNDFCVNNRKHRCCSWYDFGRSTNWLKRMSETLNSYESHMSAFFESIMNCMRWFSISEIWVHHCGPEAKDMSKEWKHTGSRPKVSPAESLPSVFWDKDRIIFITHDKKNRRSLLCFCKIMHLLRYKKSTIQHVFLTWLLRIITYFQNSRKS